MSISRAEQGSLTVRCVPFLGGFELTICMYVDSLTPGGGGAGEGIVPAYTATIRY